MTPKSGNSRRFYMSTAQAASHTWLEGEQSNNFNRSGEAIDVSDKSSNWAAFIAGRRSATADVNVNLDDTATSEQRKLLDSFDKGETVYCFVGTLTTGSSPVASEGDFFEAIVTAANDTNEKDNVASRSFSLQVSGRPIHYPVTP